MNCIIVGSGYSSAQVFLQIIEQASKKNLSGEITIIGPGLDTEGMWGRGVAWGYPRGHPKRRLEYLSNGLVQSLGANDVYELSFEYWLKKRIPDWLAEVKEAADTGNPAVRNWLEQNRINIDSEDLGLIYIPRAFFGDWISEKLNTAIKTASENNIEVRCIDSIALSVEYDAKKDSYLLSLDSGQRISGTSVALCTGRVLTLPLVSDTRLKGYFNSLHGYEEDIISILRETKGVFAIIGGSASSLDAVRFIRSTEEFSKQKIIVISPTGGFPPGGITRKEIRSYTPQLFTPEKTKFASTDALLSWCREEIKLAAEQGYSMEAVHMGIRALSEELRAALPAEHQCSFKLREVNRIFRRSPEDSLCEVRELQRAGLLLIHIGRAVSIQEEHGKLTIDIRDAFGREESISAACCVNTAGSPSLRKSLNADLSSSTFSQKTSLFNQLIKDKLLELEAESGDILIDQNCFVGSTPRLGYIGPQISSVNGKPNLFSAYSWGVLERLASSFAESLIERERIKS